MEQLNDKNAFQEEDANAIMHLVLKKLDEMETFRLRGGCDWLLKMKLHCLLH